MRKEMHNYKQGELSDEVRNFVNQMVKYDSIFNLKSQIYFCLNADRIWSSTPQITDYADCADDADFKRFSVSSGCYLSESGFTGLEDFQDFANERSVVRTGIYEIIGWVDERTEEGYLSFFLAFFKFFQDVFSVVAEISACAEMSLVIWAGISACAEVSLVICSAKRSIVSTSSFLPRLSHHDLTK